MSEEKRIKLLSKCKDINCICQDCMYLEFVKNNILKPIQQENKTLREKNEFLMQRDNKCQILEQVIINIKNFIEELYDNTDDTTCYDIDINTKEDILDILKEVE